MRKFCVSFLLLSFFTALGFASEDYWTPEDMMLEKNISQTAISRDGKWIAFCIRMAVMEGEKSEYLTHIWISKADGSSSYQLTRGDKNCTGPAWSPNGKTIAFRTNRNGKSNIWLINPSIGEAHMLTDVKTGVGSFDWSPDGSEIAFLMSDEESKERKEAKKAKNDAQVLDREYRFSHLYRVKVSDHDMSPQEHVRVTEGEFHVSGFDWSPDGKHFVISHQPRPILDDWVVSDISMIGVDGGEIRALVTLGGSDRVPMFSPDGKTVAFISDLGEPHWAGANRICLVPASGGEVTPLAKTFNESPGLLDWAADGSGIYYTEAFKTSFHIFFMPGDGTDYRKLTDHDGVNFSVDISKDNSTVAYVYEDMDVAPELHVRNLKNGSVKQITKVNVDLPDHPFARGENITWKSKDGREVEGILHYPLNYEKGKKYPLLLNIHGGPAGAFMRTFTAGAGIYPIQTFTAMGFAVLRPNPRGSTAYGKEFRFANYRDLGGGDYEDVMSGVDHLVNIGLADNDRLGVMGWSYGGYMTSVIITKNSRFKAAAAGAAPTNTISYIGVTDIRGFYPSYFGAELWEDYKIYLDKSPVMSIHNATTPTLFIHGVNDIRVPFNQGRQLYELLKRKNVETEMVVLPRTPHGPREPKLLLDVAKRHVEWFKTRLLEE